MDSVHAIGFDRLNFENNDLHLRQSPSQQGLDPLGISPISPIGSHNGTEARPITSNDEDLNLVLEKKNCIVK